MHHCYRVYDAFQANLSLTTQLKASQEGLFGGFWTQKIIADTWCNNSRDVFDIEGTRGATARFTATIGKRLPPP